MADEPTTSETDEPEPTPESDKPRSDDDVEKLKAALKKANKEAEQHRLKLKELEDRDKTDAERLAETNRTLEERARRAEIDLCRYRVAMRKGLTETQARRLVGESEEDLEADADELLEAFNTGRPAEPAGGRPKERLRSGAVPDAEPEETDPAKLAALVPRSRI
jgi:hypothetical protein